MPIKDCSFASLEEAINGTKAPPEIIANLALIDVTYVSFDGEVHEGQLVVHRKLAEDVKEIFRELLRMRFPIAKVIPIVVYDWNDEASMADNNSSSFNYRLIAGTSAPSNHADGTALDLNPMQNPFIKGSNIQPKGAVYAPRTPGTITPDGPVARLFKERGWKHGADWVSLKDYQHFEKTL